MLQVHCTILGIRLQRFRKNILSTKILQLLLLPNDISHSPIGIGICHDYQIISSIHFFLIQHLSLQSAFRGYYTHGDKHRFQRRHIPACFLPETDVDHCNTVKNNNRSIYGSTEEKMNHCALEQPGRVRWRRGSWVEAGMESFFYQIKGVRPWRRVGVQAAGSNIGPSLSIQCHGLPSRHG